MRTYVGLVVAGVLGAGVGCSAMPGQANSPTTPVVSVPSVGGTWAGTATIATCHEEKYGRPKVACTDPKLQPGRGLQVTVTASQLGDELTGTTQVEGFWYSSPTDRGIISDPFNALVPLAGPMVVSAKSYIYPSTLLQRWTLGLTGSQTLAGTTEWTHIYSKADERLHFTALAVLHRQ